MICYLLEPGRAEALILTRRPTLILISSSMDRTDLFALPRPLVSLTDYATALHVASLIEELRDLPNGEDLVPNGFDELWDVVWQVHQERQA